MNYKKVNIPFQASNSAALRSFPLFLISPQPTSGLNTLAQSLHLPLPLEGPSSFPLYHAVLLHRMGQEGINRCQDPHAKQRVHQFPFVGGISI